MAPVLVIDFGSQVTQLIVRRVRESGIYCEVVPFHAAEAASLRGDLVAAIQLYQSAIIFAPADPGSYIALARLHAANGQPELAEKYFGIALDLDPAYAPALKGLALLALAQGDRASAQARHDLLVRACGAACPETGEVAQALSQGTPN